jgi:hypothetical protein
LRCFAFLFYPIEDKGHLGQRKFKPPAEDKGHFCWVLYLISESAITPFRSYSVRVPIDTDPACVYRSLPLPARPGSTRHRQWVLMMLLVGAARARPSAPRHPRVTPHHLFGATHA